MYNVPQISDSAGGADLTSISPEEPVELTRAKQTIFDTLVRWASRDD